MKILSVHIGGFGKFCDRDLTFGPGVNVIRGRNEAGKSTLHSFLEAMLLGSNKKARGFVSSVYEAMEPWDPDTPYCGSMRVEKDGTVWQISRNFGKGEESLTVINETTGETAAEPEALLLELLSGLTPEACRNSISVGQLSARTGAALKKELAGYVENMGGTAHPELNAERAISFLKEKKERLREKIAESAAKDYAASLSRIRNIESEINRPENDNRILYYRDERVKRQEELLRVQQEIAETEERILSADGTLQENHIRTAEDVAAGDRKADELYEAWTAALRKKKSRLRIAGFVICSLLLVISAAGFRFRQDSLSRTVFLVSGVVMLAAIGFLILRARAAAGEFQTAEQTLLSFIKGRCGADGVTEENMRLTHQAIHSMDGVLEERDGELARKKELEDRAALLAQEEADCCGKLEEQQKILVMVEGKLTEENLLKSEAARLRQQIAENNRLKEQIDAIDIAIDTIGDLSAEIRGRLGTWLNDEASRALKNLTGGHYSSLDVGSGSDVALNTREGMVSVSEVSAGTVDQVYLAVRLAAARFMMQGQDALPLIFDDSFALYDDERLSGAVKFVTSDYRGQIFIFTCHHREEQVLEGTEFRLLEL